MNKIALNKLINLVKTNGGSCGKHAEKMVDSIIICYNCSEAIFNCCRRSPASSERFSVAKEELGKIDPGLLFETLV